MRYLFFVILFAAIVGCNNSSQPEKPGGKAGPATTLGKETMAKPIDGLSRYALGEPVSEGNMTLIPVVLTSMDNAVQATEYMSLTEAKKLGLVEISEMLSGQEVNRLTVKNLGKKPLLLLAGELLLGGKQDRVVGKDTVVPPGESMAVPVFCVEHGRWDGETSKFSYSSSMAPQSVRQKAVFGSQQEVWDGVAAYNAEAGAKAETTSVRGGLYDEKIQKQVDSHLDTFLAALDKQKNVVGLVYVVNGEIGSFELFGNTSLLNASRESLLKGFLADAAVQPGNGSDKVDMDAIGKFIKESLIGERQQTDLGRADANWTVNGTNTLGKESTLSDATLPVASAPQEQSMLLHGSYTKKK